MPNLTIEAQADLLAKLLRNDDTRLKITPSLSTPPSSWVEVEADLLLTPDEVQLVEMLRGAHA